MKKFLPDPWVGFATKGGRAVALALLSVFFAPSALAQATLLGTVTNSATGRTLEGARVTVQGTSREEITDKEGFYRFANITPGSAVLTVSYTGLNPFEVRLEIQAGAPHRRDVGLTADIHTLSKFVVAGEREGSALAITR